LFRLQASSVGVSSPFVPPDWAFTSKRIPRNFSMSNGLSRNGTAFTGLHSQSSPSTPVGASVDADHLLRMSAADARASASGSTTKSVHSCGAVMESSNTATQRRR